MPKSSLTIPISKPAKPLLNKRVQKKSPLVQTKSTRGRYVNKTKPSNSAWRKENLVLGGLIKQATVLLEALFVKHNMPESHGIDHCTKVLNHMKQTILARNHSLYLTLNRKIALLLGALLHEADDHKYFGKESQNALDILRQVLENRPTVERNSIIKECLECINMVSTSDNGNSIPPMAKKMPELLWVRFCDRLEAVGKIGVVRCWQYNTEKGVDPLCLPETTPRPRTTDQVWKFATRERFQNYMRVKTSASMMDHYYDKLLHIVETDINITKNMYLVSQA
jgi:uncharacterized protein